MTKLFVLDTSVLLFDHNAITNFQEHDIAIPITVLEELDRFKIGNETRNFEARSVIRFLDKLAWTKGLNKWIHMGADRGRLKIVMNTDTLEIDAEQVYGEGKNDHKILNVALMLQHKTKRTKVILVSKDINLRIKAKALGLLSEDYKTGKVDLPDHRTEGMNAFQDLDAGIITDLYKKKRIAEDGIFTRC